MSIAEAPMISYGNIAGCLDEVANVCGERVAIGSIGGGTTYAQLRLAAGRMSEVIEATCKARVTWSGPLDVEMAATLFGAAWAGATFCPLNFRLPPQSLDNIKRQLEPALHLSPGSNDFTPTGLVGQYPINPVRPALHMPTSGTTAAPKVAILDHRQVLVNACKPGLASASADEATLLVVPSFHVAGVVSFLAAIYAGRRVVVPVSDRFSAREWVAAARCERITYAFLVPTMLHRIVELLEATGERLTELRQITYGGSRMPLPVIERAMELLPHVSFMNTYGMTETSGAVTTLTPDDHRASFRNADPGVRARLGSVGRAGVGVDIHILDERGDPLPTGTPGAIAVRGPQVNGSYVGGATRTGERGWLLTGDRGWVDPDGYLFCEGRADETIIRGGENIAPAEIEDVLLAHSAVSAAAVVGIPDLEWGESLAAAVIIRPDQPVTEADLREHICQTVGNFKTPDRIVFRDALPQTATGKVMRRAVRQDVIDELSAATARPDDNTDATKETSRA